MKKDNIDMDNKIIKYWGDAKYKAKKMFWILEEIRKF